MSPGLSLVFNAASGGRKRVPIKAAGKHTGSDDLGPNVLLRPIVERAILPTVTYVGGPAEIAYFAQILPIADVLGIARPSIVPRWSCVIIEPHVEKILEKLHLLPEDLRDPHEAEARVARSRLPKRVLDELNATRAVLNERLDALSAASRGGKRADWASRDRGPESESDASTRPVRAPPDRGCEEAPCRYHAGDRHGARLALSARQAAGAESQFRAAPGALRTKTERRDAGGRAGPRGSASR